MSAAAPVTAVPTATSSPAAGAALVSDLDQRARAVFDAFDVAGTLVPEPLCRIMSEYSHPHKVELLKPVFEALGYLDEAVAAIPTIGPADYGKPPPAGVCWNEDGGLDIYMGKEDRLIVRRALFSLYVLNPVPGYTVFNVSLIRQPVSNELTSFENKSSATIADDIRRDFTDFGWGLILRPRAPNCPPASASDDAIAAVKK